MQINNAKFEITAVSSAQYPAGNLPEITFVGRSNVGKSSIINTMVNRKNLARVGATPGKTREINFYNLDEKLYFVDLPGYGYASVSKDKKNSWDKIIGTYLNSRLPLKLILMLVDIRHTPSADDKLMYTWLTEYDLPHIIVATKADKISRGQIHPRLQDIKKALNVKEDIVVIPFSAETRQGKDEIWKQIDGVVLGNQSIVEEDNQ